MNKNPTTVLDEYSMSDHLASIIISKQNMF